MLETNGLINQTYLQKVPFHMCIYYSEWLSQRRYRRHFQLTSSNILALTLQKTHSATDTLNDFTTDIEQNCSNNNLVLVTALKQPIDRMKRQLSDKQFIIGLLLANLQHCSYNTSVSTGIQVLAKKQEKISIWSVQK